MKINKVVNVTGFISIILLMTIAWNCENVKDYTDPTDNIPPGKVTSVEVENLHGGAIITYTLPPDKDLLGVKAVYRLREDGKEYEAYSSAHRDTIILAGFPDTNEHIVSLYAIDLSRNVSEPVQVPIKPLTPPVDLIRKSLKVNETFGGLYCTWENIMEENIAVSLYVDSIGEMTLDDTFFSKTSEGGYAFRGFPNKEYSFRIEIRDRWLNYAAPLDTVLTPMFEQQILGREEANVYWSLWGYNNLECLSRGDNYASLGSNRDFSVAFDGILRDETNWYWFGDDYCIKHYIPGWPSTDDTYPSPAYWSIDLGREAVYSRFKMYIRVRANLYEVSFPIEFELWGTNSPKPLVNELTDEDRLTNLRYWTSWTEVDGTDAWKNDWIRLGDYNFSLPSGARYTTDVITAEDQEYIRNGYEYLIDLDKTNIPCRYVRFVLKKYSNLTTNRPMNQIGELQFFGAFPK